MRREREKTSHGCKRLLFRSCRQLATIEAIVVLFRVDGDLFSREGRAREILMSQGKRRVVCADLVLVGGAWYSSRGGALDPSVGRESYDLRSGQGSGSTHFLPPPMTVVVKSGPCFESYDLEETYGGDGR